ncbi:hypothetical protein [Thiohalorhabdus sp.]|uniref:hypothetical protein n=1 Tax=Thiohalorhabdus sp. TaxID=3094134 RepID=UPI002FC35F0F
MDTGFLHKAAETVRGWIGGHTESGAEVPVRMRGGEEDEPAGGPPVEPLYPDQVESIAHRLDQRLESMAQGELYAYQGEPPTELGNALNLDAGLVLIALDETLASDESGREQLREVMEQWGELRGEALPEQELEEFLQMAEEYRRAWREFPGAEPFPFILAIGATDAYMLAEEEEAPRPEEVAPVAAAMMDDAARFYGELTRILGAR